MKKIIINTVFFLFTMVVFSQIENIPKSSFLEMQKFSESFSPGNITSAKALNENKVFIQQVGEGNNVAANVRAQNSLVSINQNGNNNHVGVNVNVEDYKSIINQIGDKNNFFDQIYNTHSDASIELNQTGTNLHFERFGTNSIGDKLQFNMTGDSKSIIVRNFN